MFSDKRGSGVLLNISSLKGNYAVGTFGKEVENFCHFLNEIGAHYWQILPITAIGIFNSPYSSESAFAGNYIYISPDLLAEDGLIDYDMIEDSRYTEQIYRVNYSFAKMNKKRVLESAYARNDLRYLLDEYIEQEKTWIKDYAAYMTIKEHFGYKAWWEWPDELKHCNKDAVDKFMSDKKDRFYFYVFEQYIFSKQWKQQLETIHSHGIKIIGDMPIYVSRDSADVWANIKYFDYDENLNQQSQAGVPPDYFSATGQLWGNPLYNYVEMKKDGYKWWLNRFRRMFDLYDILRIDHFRAFDRYWSVPIDADSAMAGKWLKGPGMDLFNIINNEFDADRIIAEDLGTIDDGVRELLKDTTYPGMRVMQFAFGDFESSHLPHNYPLNTIAYVATHDNNTTLGWLYELDDNVRNYVFDYLEIDRSNWQEGGYNSTSIKRIIKKLYASSAVLAVVPFQDLCGYGADTRMNIPGIAASNWEFRVTQEAMDSVDKNYYKRISQLYGRDNQIIK